MVSISSFPLCHCLFHGKSKLVFQAALLLLAGGALEAQPFPSLEPAPQAHEYARRIAHNGGHWRDLAEASLWASSVNAGPEAEGRAAAYLGRIEAAVAELTAADLPLDVKERGEYILNFLHRRFLKSYSANQTRVDEILASGRYNCVSSAALYMVLARSAGLDAAGVVTRDHAFATVNTGAEFIDVETTNRYGFDPGNRKEFHDAFGKITGFAYTPAKNYRDRTAIGGAELVSLILANRISALEEQKRYADAVPLAINRAALLSTSAVQHGELFSDPRQDMMRSLFNVGVHYIQTGKEDNAIAWAKYAEGRYPDPAGWQELYKSAANNKLVKLIRAKKTSDARSTLAAVQPKLSDENYRELDTMVFDAEAVDKVNAVRNSAETQAALAFLAQDGGRLQPQRRDEMRTKVILDEAERLRKARKSAEAINWLESAMRQYGANAKLETALRTLRQDRVAELHNEFAGLYNRRQFEQAKVSIQRSLQEFPGDRTLVQDLNLVEKALQQ